MVHTMTDAAVLAVQPGKLQEIQNERYTSHGQMDTMSKNEIDNNIVYTKAPQHTRTSIPERTCVCVGQSVYILIQS